MDVAIKEAISWLEAHAGSKIRIQKEELAIGTWRRTDIDHIQLQLERVEIQHNRQAEIDDYIASHEICLHGSGTIQVDQGEVELPHNMYEIPLHGRLRTTSKEKQLRIETDKAVYTIQPLTQAPNQPETDQALAGQS